MGRLRRTPSPVSDVYMSVFTIDGWWDRLISGGFDKRQPAVVTSTGVSMYLSTDAVASMLRRVTALAPGSRWR